MGPRRGSGAGSRRAATALALWAMRLTSTRATTDSSVVSIEQDLPTTTMLIMCAQDASIASVEWENYANGVDDWGHYVTDGEYSAAGWADGDNLGTDRRNTSDPSPPPPAQAVSFPAPTAPAPTAPAPTAPAPTAPAPTAPAPTASTPSSGPTAAPSSHLPSGAGTSQAPPSASGMSLFAVTTGSSCAETLPYGSSALSAQQTSAYVSTRLGDARHETWLQVLDPGDGTAIMYITWHFADWATVAERFYTAVNGGIPVTWDVQYGSGTVTKSGTWWWSDQGANYRSLFASGSGSSFSPDDGLWGAGTGVVNGDHGMVSDFWGHGNLNGGDGQCSNMYTGSTSGTSRPNLVNRMYVDWTPIPPPPSLSGFSQFAVTTGSQCAEALPYGSSAIAAQQTSAYVSTFYGDARHETWLQVLDPRDGTAIMYITWHFSTWATVAERFYSAVNGGIPVTWDVQYDTTTVTQSGTWWWSDQGADYRSLFASGSGSSFSPDDGLWGAGTGVVNGDHGMASDFWGHGNLNGGDGQCSNMYTGSTSGVSKPSLINRMYVHWTLPTPPPQWSGSGGGGGQGGPFGSGGSVQPGSQDHLDCINATRQLFTDLYLLVKSPQDFTKDAKGGFGSNRDAVCAPRNGAPSCKNVLMNQFHQFYSNFGPFEGEGDACDGKPQVALAGKSAVGVAGLLLDFVCLEGTTLTGGTEPCGPAMVHAINDGHLADALTTGARITPGPDTISACGALSKVGCCATSFVDMLKVYMRLMCVQASSKITAAFRNLYPLCVSPNLGSGVAVPSGCGGFDPGQYTTLAPDQCPTENKFKVPQFGNWQNITGIGNLNDVARQCAEDQSGQCPGDLCSFGCFASRSMVEIFSSLFLDGDAQPGGGMTVLEEGLADSRSYDPTLSAGLNLGFTQTMLVLAAVAVVVGAAVLTARRLRGGGYYLYRRVDGVDELELNAPAPAL